MTLDLGDKAEFKAQLLSGATPRALLQAIARYCACEHDEQDELVRVCPGHKVLSDPRFVGHLEYGRQIADTLVLEEWMVDLKDAMRPRVTEPEPYLVSEFSWSILKGMDL